MDQNHHVRGVLVADRDDGLGSVEASPVAGWKRVRCFSDLHCCNGFLRMALHSPLLPLLYRHE